LLAKIFILQAAGRKKERFYMKIAPLPHNERERLEELRKYGILDTEPEAVFNSMVQLASYICHTPFAAISLIDEHRQWFKAIVGVEVSETPRDVAFCAHTILQQEPMIIPNTLEDKRFFDNPLVEGGLNLRFYAGVPLVTESGYLLGTLCVFDQQPRQLSAEQLDAIKTLADSVMAHLDLRLSHREIRKYVDDLQLAASIFETASEAVLVTGPQNHIITVNPAFTAMTGYSLSEVVGKTPNILCSGRQDAAFYQRMWQSLEDMGHWSGELWNKRKSGELYAEWLSINVLFNEDGSKRMYVAIFSDVTEKKQADEIIWRQANYDMLTQLPGRRLFYDRLEHEIRGAHRAGCLLALLFIDLDLFKEVNDSLGHEAGDLLLVKAAERLTASVRESDTVARMGGDEFTAILPQIDSLEDVERVAALIVTALSAPFEVNGTMVNISASVGVAIYPGGAQNATELLSQADRAMYVAKAQGRGCYRMAD
jgi:diguanylate cyclase (GGDEF)-like protein/PAS domain S-box-containing protein